MFLNYIPRQNKLAATEVINALIEADELLGAYPKDFATSAYRELLGEELEELSTIWENLGDLVRTYMEARQLDPEDWVDTIHDWTLIKGEHLYDYLTEIVNGYQIPRLLKNCIDIDSIMTVLLENYPKINIEGATFIFLPPKAEYLE